MITLFRPPDRYTNYQCYLVYIFSIIWMSASTAVLSVGFFLVPGAFWRWFTLIIVTNSVCLSCLWLNEKGYTRLASHILPIFLYLLITWMASTSGGISAPALFNYVPVILITGFLLGGKRGIIMALLITLTALVFTYAQLHGFLPAPHVTFPPLMRWVVYLLPFGVVIAIQYYATGHIRNSLERINSEMEERKKAEKTEYELHTRLKAIFEKTNDAIVLADGSGNYVQVNPAAAKMLGYSEEELTGMNTADIISGRQTDELWNEFMQDGSQTGAIELVRKDGSLIICHYNATSNILPGLHLSILTNITERKKAEQQLKLFASVATNTNDSVLITEAEPFDEPGPRILYVNDAFTKMTGYTAEEVIGKSPRMLQGPKSDKVELARIGKMLRNWESCEATVINYKKNREEFWINFTLSPVADEKGWYTHWISIEREVTTRKNEELQNELIANISTVFIEPLKLHETLDRTLRYIAGFGDFCFAEAWLTSTDQNSLNKISSHAATENMSLFLKETNSIDTFSYGESFPGNVFKTKEIVIWGDLANQKLFLRRDAALKYGLKTMIGLPLLCINEVIGVLAFGLDYEVIDTAKYLSLFKTLGDYLGPEIKRKQLELELKQMFNFAPDLIVTIGLDGCFKRVNPAASKILGYTQEALCAEPYAHFIHPEDREKSANEVAKLLETNLTYYFENRYITKSGKIKWLAWNAIYVTEDNSIYAVAKDITEKKELENLLKKVNELARIGVWEVDLQNNTIFWSDITKEIHEVALDYIPDLETGIAFYKEGGNRTKITEYIQQAINSGKSYDDEFQIITAKGNEKWVRAIGEAESINGNNIRIYGSFQDIDERKKAESKLIENENYLRTILENEPECVKVLNSKGELLSMNPAGLAMIEADNEQQVLGHRMTDLVNKKYQIGFNRLTKEVFNGNSGTFEFEVTGLKGRQRWLETHAVPLKDIAGKVINLLGVTRDITERKKAETQISKTTAELHQLTDHLQTVREEERQRIAREIHDDLGQQLTAIKMDTVWIDKQIPSETVAVKNKLQNMLELLDGSHQSVRKILNELRPTALDDNGLLEALQWQGRQFTESTGIPVHFKTNLDSCNLTNETATCIFRVYQESLTNIMRYAHATVVVSSLNSSNESIILAIEDDGNGFDTKRAQSKKSFGLLGMRERVFSLHGKFDLISSPGKGTKIVVSLPIKLESH